MAEGERWHRRALEECDRMLSLPEPGGVTWGGCHLDAPERMPIRSASVERGRRGRYGSGSDPAAVSRSMFLPILGLMGIILFGTMRATRPASPEDEMAEFAPAEMYTPAPAVPRAQAPPPPPAPRLKSVEEEEARQDAEAALAAARTRLARADSIPRTPTDSSYVPAPIVPGR